MVDTSFTSKISTIEGRGGGWLHGPLPPQHATRNDIFIYKCAENVELSDEEKEIKLDQFIL